MGSIEEQVEDWAKKQFKNLKYYTKTETINSEIDFALEKAPSKKGGTGKNYPDIKYLIETAENRRIPVMIEVKGTKGSFVKFESDGITIANTSKNEEPNYTNISKYAINGAFHYAKAILDYTESFKECIFIGINGYNDNSKTIYELGVYYVSKENLFIPKEIAKYQDLSFLQRENLNEFIKNIDNLSLSEEELEKKKLELEDDIEKKLKNINQKMHDDLGIVVGSRV